MCLAIPGKIIEVHESYAIVDYGRARKEIYTTFVENLRIGDYVLAHAGFAIGKIDERAASENLSHLLSKDMGDGDIGESLNS